MGKVPPLNAGIIPVESCLQGMTIASVTSMSNIEMDHRLLLYESLSMLEIASRSQPGQSSRPLPISSARGQKRGELKLPAVPAVGSRQDRYQFHAFKDRKEEKSDQGQR